MFLSSVLLNTPILKEIKDKGDVADALAKQTAYNH